MGQEIRYSRFGGPEVLEIAEVEDVQPGEGEVRLAVGAVGLNPMDYKVFGGDPKLRLVGALRSLAHPSQWGSPTFPRGVGRDFAGTIDAVGGGVDGFSVGDAVLGTLRGAPGLGMRKGTLTQELVASVDDVVRSPGSLSVEVGASLGVSAQTACGALRHLHVARGDVVVISAAAGGVGSLAVQLAVHRGATVIGIVGERSVEYVRALGAIPVVHGAGVKDKVRAVAPAPVTALLDCFGGDYVAVGFALGLPGRAIGTLVPSPGAIIRGAQFTGSRHACPEDLPEVAGLVDEGTLAVTLAGVVPCDIESVRGAYRQLARGHVRGKLVVSMKERNRSIRDRP